MSVSGLNKNRRLIASSNRNSLKYNKGCHSKYFLIFPNVSTIELDNKRVSAILV